MVENFGIFRKTEVPALYQFETTVLYKTIENFPLFFRGGNGIVSAVDKQSFVFYFFSAGAQIFVDNLFITLFHKRRKRAVFSASVMPFRKLRKELFNSAVSLYFAHIFGGTRFYESRAAGYYKPCATAALIR